MISNKNSFETVNPDRSIESLSSAIETQKLINLAICILLFQVGFSFFEYGQARSKSADSTLIKHAFLFFSAALLTFLSGYAMAYGLREDKDYILGTQHFLSTDFSNLNSRDYLLMIPQMSLISTVSVSSLNERQSVFA
jgi:ammonia channel protein AmtB